MLLGTNNFTKLDFVDNTVSFIALKALPHAELLSELEDKYGLRFIETDRSDDHIHLIDVVSMFTFKDLECTIPDLWIKIFSGSDGTVKHHNLILEFDVESHRNTITTNAIHITDGSVGYNSEFMAHFRQAVNELVFASLMDTVNATCDDAGVVHFNCDINLIRNAALLLSSAIDNTVRFDLLANDDLMVVNYNGSGFISIHDAVDLSSAINFYETGTISIRGTVYNCTTINVMGELMLVIHGYDNNSVAYNVESKSIVGAQFAAYMMCSKLLVKPISLSKGTPHSMAYLTMCQ